jgi:hypothetical protein
VDVRQSISSPKYMVCGCKYMVCGCRIWYVDVVYGMWMSYMVCGVSTNGKELFRGRLHGDQVKVLKEAAVGALL